MEYKILLKRAKLANNDYKLTKEELKLFTSADYHFTEPILSIYERSKIESKFRKGRIYFGKPATRRLLKQLLGQLQMEEIKEIMGDLASVIWKNNAAFYALVTSWSMNKEPLLKEQVFLSSYRKLLN